MSLDIGWVGQTRSTSPAGSSRAGAPSRSDAEPTDAGGEAVEVDIRPSAPPSELTAAISTAARAYDDLAASGRQLHFEVDTTTKRLRIELRDLSGGVITTLSPRQVLDIADGTEPR